MFQALVGALRKLSWSGIPQALRPVTWKLLCVRFPSNRLALYFFLNPNCLYY